MEKYVYKHVAIIGLDGMGIFDRFTDTPNFDRIFGGYAVSHSSVSLYPTISAQNWGAMLIGADPAVHGLTNGIVGSVRYENKELPTVFSTVREKMPGAVLCSVCHWSPVNYGIVEEGIGVYKENGESGEDTTKKVVAYLEKQIPELLYVHIDDPDHGGHSGGYGSDCHFETIRGADRMTGEIFDAYERAGVLDDTLFITVTDHGGYINGHGGYTDGEKYIYFALRGKTVNNTNDFFAKTKDINAIVRHAFGIEIPPYNKNGYSSQVPEGVFSDCDTPYLTETPVRNDVENRPTPAIDGEGGLYEYFDRDDVAFALFLDGDTKDAAGKVTFREEGLVKFYSGGVRGQLGEFGTTGCLVADSVKFGSGSFSVSAWLMTDDAPAGECFYISDKTMAGPGPGFSFGFNVAGSIFGIETEDPSTYYETGDVYNDEISGGWINLLTVVDKEKMEARLYRNFELKKTVKLPEIYDCSVDALPLTIGEDGSRTCNRRMGMTFRADDIIAFNRALDDADAKKLAAYYGL